MYYRPVRAYQDKRKINLKEEVGFYLAKNTDLAWQTLVILMLTVAFFLMYSSSGNQKEEEPETVILRSHFKEPMPPYELQEVGLSGKPIDKDLKRYMVQPNDTLWGISLKLETTVERLSDLNELQPPYILSIGQVLVY